MKEIPTLNPDEILYEEEEQFDSLPSGQKQKYYLYELKKLIKGKSDSLLTFSPNSVNLVIIDKDEHFEFNAWKPDAQVFEYRTRQSVSNVDGEIDIAQYEKENINSNIDLSGNSSFSNGVKFKYSRNKLYLVSEFLLQTDDDILNFGYLIQKLEVDSPVSENMLGNKMIEIVDLNTWAARDSNNAIFRIGKQIDNIDIEKIEMESPSSFMLNGMSVLGEDENNELEFSDINVENDLACLWVNPIEVKNESEVNLFNFWMTDGVMEFELAKKYIVPANISEDIAEEGDPTGNNTVTYKEGEIVKVSITGNWKGRLPGTFTDVPFGSGGGTWQCQYSAGKETTHTSVQHFEVGTTTTIKQSHAGCKQIPGGTGSYSDTMVEMSQVVLTTKERYIVGTLTKLLKDVLTASFNYKNNFKGAGYKNQQTGELNTMALYKQEFEGKNIVEYVDGLEKKWEQKYPNKVNSIQYINYKKIRNMLSPYIFGSLSTNQGLNEDNKILLPWYFQLLSVPTYNGKEEVDKEDGNYIWEYPEGIKVQLKSEYFSFEDINIPKNKHINISDSVNIKNNEGTFLWPTIPNKINENSLPSLTPKDFKLSDENVCKYIVFVKNTWISKFGTDNELFKLTAKKVKTLNDNKKTNFIFNVKTKNLKHINILGIYGSGEWNLKLIAKDEKNISLSRLPLFKINKQVYGNIKLVF